MRAVAQRSERAGPDDAPIPDDGHGEAGHLADSEEARDVACQGGRIGRSDRGRAIGWNRANRRSDSRGRTAAGEGEGCRHADPSGKVARREWKGHFLLL